MSLSPTLQSRIDAVRDTVRIEGVIAQAVTLGKGRKPRGKCPFHGSKSDSFAVDPDHGRARCWGCGWAGDAIRFVQDFYGLSFAEALAQLESGAGLDSRAAAPVHREKRVQTGRAGSDDVVESIVLGRYLWKKAVWNPDAVRTYLTARGVPGAVLDDRRLADIRFVALGPIVPWRITARPDSVPQAPAIVALVRAMPKDGARAGMGPGPSGDLDDWPPLGVHVTWLRPDLAGKMERQRRDGSAYPARKMLGPVGGGGVWLPGADFGLPPQAPLFVGEGLETVLSGMALAGAGPDSWGLALLSLDNLQGRVPRIRGAIALYDPHPDPEHLPLCFGHEGPVTGLIDADMKPLRGPIDRQTGVPTGEAVIEVRRGPVVRRVVTTGERATLCGRLFVAAWRAKGCRARAIRPHMGQDFNDAAQEAMP